MMNDICWRNRLLVNALAIFADHICSITGLKKILLAAARVVPINIVSRAKFVGVISAGAGIILLSRRKRRCQKNSKEREQKYG